MGNKDKKLLTELKKASGFSDKFIESLTYGHLITNADGKILMVNSAFCDLTGFKREDLIGAQLPYVFLPLESYESMHTCLEKTLNQGTGHFEFPFLCENGDVFPAALGTSLIKTNGGSVSAIFITVEDITNRNKAEELLIESEKSLNTIINNIGDLIFVKDEQYRILMVNDAFCDFFSLNRVDIIGTTMTENILPEELEGFFKIDKEVLSTGVENFREEEITTKNGEQLILSTKKTRYIDTQGNKMLIGVSRDVTQLKKAESDLKETQNYLEGLVDSMKEGLVVLSKQGEIISINPAICEMTGFDESELVGQKPPFPFHPPEILEEVGKRFKVLEKKDLLEDFDIESTYLRKNGTRFPVQVSISSVFDVKGNKIVNFAIARDVTKQKQNEQEIKSAKEYLEKLLDSMNEGLIVLNPEGEVLSVNPSICKMTGFDKSELVGKKTPLPFHPLDLQADLERRIKAIKKQGLSSGYDIESTYLRKNGTRFPVHVSISSVHNSDGKKLANFAVVQDITQRKKAELELKLSKEFTDKLIMSMQEGLIIVNLKGEIIMINDSICKILGYTRKELIGLQLPYPFLATKDIRKVLKSASKVIKGEAPSFYFEFTKQNGETFLASFLTGNIKNDTGKVIALFGTIKDVSEENKVKIALQDIANQSAIKKDAILKLAGLVGQDFKQSLKTITKLASQTLKTSRVSIWRFDAAKNEIFCENLYDQNHKGYKKSLKIKQSDNPNYFKVLEERKTIAISNAVTNPITKAFANTYLIPNNIISLMDVSINSANGKYGIICFEHVGDNPKEWSAEDQQFASSVASIVSLMIESTQRKEAEQALIYEKMFSEDLINSMHEGLSVVDVNGVHVKVNNALCEMTGFSQAELIGIKDPFPYWPPEEYDNIYYIYNNLLEGLGTNLEFTFMRKNGERFPVSLSSSFIKNMQGEIIAYFATVTDITIKVKAENVLKESVKLADQRKNTLIELTRLVKEDFEASLKNIVKISAEALHVEYVSIWEYTNEHTELINKVYYNSNKITYETDDCPIKKINYPNYFNAFKGKNAINISNVYMDPRTKAFANEHYNPKNIYSLLEAVIYGKNGNYGIISFESSVIGRVFTAEEEAFVTSIASIVSLMVESAERKLAEKRIVKSNELLTEANKELNVLRNHLEQENVYLKNELDLVFNFEEMVYGSEEFSSVLTELEKVAPTNATVLLLGESGTGKELLARAVHNISLRKNKPFIKVNCSAIPRELMESELFGHKKGSFTGAFSDKIGKFELADGGTLFLDEIGELPLDMQPKILRFLQEGEMETVGGMSIKKLDVRVVAATNKNLKEAVDKKEFRDDLYFRLNVFPIEVPPLRKRIDDIPLLVEHFINKFNKNYSKHVKFIPDDTMTKLKAYKWPGNIRELENLMERAVILSNDGILEIPGFESANQVAKAAINSKDLTLSAAQRNHILQILEQCNWKISGPNGASVLLGLKPSTLRDKMTKLNLKKSN